MIFEIWVERLAKVDAQQALQNLNEHIDSSSFFPTIAEIIRRDPERPAYYNQLQLETAELAAYQDEWERKASDPPPHVLARLQERKARGL